MTGVWMSATVIHVQYVCVHKCVNVLEIDVVQRAKVVSHLPSCSVWDRGLLVHLLSETEQSHT